MEKEKSLGINSGLLSDWYKNISIYPKINIKEAKKILEEQSIDKISQKYLNYIESVVKKSCSYVK